MRQRGLFMAIEGIDGCGKTTVAREVATTHFDACAPQQSARAESEVVFVSRRTIGGVDEFSAHLMRQNANMLWNSGDGTTLTPAFWVTLQASWFTALSDTVIEPLLAQGRTVIVDGWFYKFWSKLLNQNYALGDLETIFAGSRRPDHVILLNPDVAATYDRGRGFRRSELGMHAGLGDLGRATFVDYQTRGLRHLEEFAACWDWGVVDVDDNEAREVTVSKVRGVLDAFVGGSRSAFSQ